MKKLIPISILSLGIILLFLSIAHAQNKKTDDRPVVYKKRNVVDFDASLIEGDVKNPGEFYFVHRPEEKFDSLVKKRKNFHKEMLRDVVLLR